MEVSVDVGRESLDHRILPDGLADPGRLRHAKSQGSKWPLNESRRPAFKISSVARSKAAVTDMTWEAALRPGHTDQGLIPLSPGRVAKTMYSPQKYPRALLQKQAAASKVRT